MTHTLHDNSRLQLDCAGKMLDLSTEPAIMGIVNLTPDSFFDGGIYNTPAEGTHPERAVETALSMVHAGAAIIDVGGESTRPGAARVSAAEEIDRTIPFIELLRKNSEVLISIDTWKSEVAEAALRAGANIVNDISGFTFDTDMPALCGRYRCGVVLMHTPAKPEELKWSQETGAEQQGVMQRVSDFLKRSAAIAEEHGLASIILDPGFGFGKSVRENFELLARLDELHRLGYPVLAGVSRKSFLGQAIRNSGQEAPPPAERLNATISANTVALMNGADILRVHDVEAAVQSRDVVMATRKAISALG